MTIAYHVVGMIPTHGTMLSVLETMRGGRVVHENGYGRIVPGRVGLHSFDFPDPIGAVTMIDYPSSEVLTVPRHVRARNVNSLLSANLLGPKPVQMAAPMMTTVGPLLARTPALKLMRAAIRRLPEGPTIKQRQSVTFTVVGTAIEGATIQQATVRRHRRLRHHRHDRRRGRNSNRRSVLRPLRSACAGRGLRRRLVPRCAR